MPPPTHATRGPGQPPAAPGCSPGHAGRSRNVRRETQVHNTRKSSPHHRLPHSSASAVMKTSAHRKGSCSRPSLEEGKLKSKRCISESTSYASLRGCSVTPLPLIYGPPPPGRGNHSLTCLKTAAVAISTLKKLTF